MTVWGYVRVSTSDQTIENQKLVILEYCGRNHLHLNEWIDVNASSQKSPKKRRLNELMDKIQSEDVLIVSELSRLGRSVGQIAVLVDELIKRQVKVICLKEGIFLNGEANIQTKSMITLFSLFSEIEQQLISERTKEGLARARASGRILGRPKGATSWSRLDEKKQEIKEYLDKGVNKANIAKIYGVSWPTIKSFISSRGLEQDMS